MPRRTLVGNLELEELGVLGDANITELSLRFLALEPDLLSLELDDSFGELCLRKDPTTIFASAQALMLLQKQCGLFPRILGKGDNAKRLADLLERMRSEEDVNAAADLSTSYLTSFGLTPSSTIENLIIIDREVDYPTVLATQLTYEGLLDEVFGITNNQTEVDTSVLAGAAPQPQTQNGAAPTTTAATKRKIQLDSSDKLYPSIRDSNFANIGPLLNRTARRLQTDQQTIHNAEQTLSDLKSFVQKLPSYQAEQTSLKIHTSLAEEVMKYTRTDIFRRTLEIEQNLLAGSDATTMHDNIEELIARGVPLRTVLRLLCLESCLSNGIRLRELENFKRLVVQAYGYQHLLTLASLEKMGVLVPRESHRGYLNPIAGTAGQTSTDWNAVRNALTLWFDDIEEADPQDIAFVFSGYAPLSVRLVQCVLQKSYVQSLAAAARQPAAATYKPGWTGFEDVLSKIRGATVDVVQKGSDADAASARNVLRGTKQGPKTSIVFFLGGVTYAEVAALRFVKEKLEKESGRSLVICTTSMIGGRKAVDVATEGRVFGA